MQKFEKVRFVNLKSRSIIEAFDPVFSAFKPLHAHKLTVKQKPLKNTTMQAQPMINWNFFSAKRREYVIHVSPFTRLDPELRTADLPYKVLRGWFAHELGHLMDFQTRPWYNLAIQGIGYLLLRNVRMGMEKTADMFAMEFGFGEDIMATKHYILSHANVPLAYKRQITRYYLSPAETERMLLEIQEEESKKSTFNVKVIQSK